MISCPSSSKAIFTGRLASADEFEIIAASQNAVGCDVCGELHSWRQDQAWLEPSHAPSDTAFP